jgi:alpha-L-fucosidase
MLTRPIHFLLLATFVLSVACQPGTKEQQTEQSDTLRTALTDEEILNESREAFNERMEWWRDAKFGMFIHWGPYAVPAGEYQGNTVNGIAEWIMDKAQIPIEEYEEYARQFDPQQYDADAWVKLAKDAGMKYIVITSKHHDGFALWDSEVSDYDVMDFAPIKRDLLAELKAACEKHGVKFCVYHSIMDWHHPDAQAPHYPDYNDKTKSNPNFQTYVDNFLYPQLTELVTQYEPHVLWFDGEWIPEWTHENGVALYTYLRKLDPDLIINNRVDKGRQGMQGMNKGSEYLGDFGTPEQEILEGTSNTDWEACMTMNDSWGYKSADDNWKSTELLIHHLIDVAAKGGNYLLNVGPTAEGLIPEPSVARLEEIGRWMDINHEAIYATQRLEEGFEQGEHIRFTRKKDEPVFYAIALQKPEGSMSFDYLQPAERSDVVLLGYDEPLQWTFDEKQALVVQVPPAAAATGQYAWVFRVQGK